MDDEPIRPLVPRRKGSIPPPSFPMPPIDPSPMTPRSFHKRADSAASTLVPKTPSVAASALTQKSASTPLIPRTQCPTGKTVVPKFSEPSSPVSKASSSPLTPKSVQTRSTANTTPNSTPPTSPSKAILKNASESSPIKPPPPPMTKKVKEKAFFAFVLLPLSCWYTRGGKRLKGIEEDFEDEPFRVKGVPGLKRTRTMERRSSVGRRSSIGQEMREERVLRRRGSVSDQDGVLRRKASVKLAGQVLVM